MIVRSILIIHSDSRIFCLVLSSLDPLRPLVNLRPPSKILLFSHSVSLSLLHICLTLSKSQHHTTFSPYTGALSLSDTHAHRHYLNGYMGWCGCHEILIALCYPKQSFVPSKMSLKATEIRYLDHKRSAQR